LNSILLVIIGDKLNLRSSSLGKLALESEWNEKMHFVDPVILDKPSAPWILDLYCWLHYGSRLTLGEWGSSLAHQKAQNLALDLEGEWVLFLEDDAVIDSDFKRRISLLLDDLNSINTELAAIQCFGDLEENPPSQAVYEVEKIRAVPFHEISGGVGYLLHRSTLALCNQISYFGHPIGKSDFPAWGHLANWWQVSRPLVHHDGTLVSLVGDRIRASAPRGLGFKFGHALIRVALSLIPILPIPRRSRWELGQLADRLGSSLRNDFKS
jgi:hypothetical protein